ncbi:hypothetical protein HQQ81_15555 [Microbacteriaceae bacterium VKM Ac-2854]|nr:hypothetical protein [Microbacteriaceae bacterium VKM Ac-2854]
MIDTQLQSERLVFPHQGVDFAVVKLGPAEWDLTEPSGASVGRLTVLATAGEENEPVYLGTPVGADTSFEGTDWRGIVAAVINDVDFLERERRDVNPPAAHVRGGLISRVRSEVDGLS